MKQKIPPCLTTASHFASSFLSFYEFVHECVGGNMVSVQFSCSVRPPCPSLSPAVHSNSRPSSQWCHPAISSSVIPFSSCLQSFPASGSFLESQFFSSGGESIGVSASASVLPMNIQGWFPLGWTGWISLQCKGLSESSPTPQFKSSNSSALSFLHSPTFTSIHDHWKNHSLD